MIAGSIWLIAIVLLLAAHRRLRGRRGRVGAAGAGAIYGWLNEDKRKAVEIVVEGRAEARDAEDRDGNSGSRQTPALTGLRGPSPLNMMRVLLPRGTRP
jgi:hypothetical protein